MRGPMALRCIETEARSPVNKPVDWKVAVDRRLMDVDVEGWTTGMLWNEARATASPPSKPTFERWLSTAEASGRLRKVRKGLFLNATGNKSVSAGAAAGQIKHTAVPSLAWVLEQNWILNNMGDAITCVVSLTSGLNVPNLSAVKTPVGEFRFRALPWHVYELDGLNITDWRDARYAHPRATPEKALCDWLYLAASPRSPVRYPPLDMEVDRFNAGRLRRVAKAMGIQERLRSWLESQKRYSNDPDVIENASTKTTAPSW